MKIFVCDTWDSLCDMGEHAIDRYCYRTREDAEKRARRLRLTYTEDGVDYYARVVELEARWKVDGYDYQLIDYGQELLAEDAKLRELMLHLYKCMCNIDADGNHECDSCEYDNANGGCDFERLMRELEINVS